MATQKKAVAKKTANKKPGAKKSSITKKAVQKELSGQEIALKQSLEDPKMWGTYFPGKPIDHFMPLKTAKKLVRNFNVSKGPFPKDSFMQPSNISKGILVNFLNRPEVKYLRFYFGLNEHNKVQVIFVGADAKHNDVYVLRAVADSTQPATQSAREVAPAAAATPPPAEQGAIDLAQGCPAYGSGDSIILPS